MNKVLEVCCGSYYDALQAQKGGAQRIELNSALPLGGLTPSLATLKKVKEDTNVKVICMVRNRPCGFCYVKEDMDVIFYDAKLLLENGADGLAFGFLNEDKTIHQEATKQMVELIHSFNKEAVFHRAIDVTSDYMKALEDIIACGCDRVLTSGAGVKAIDGIKLIKKAQAMYGDKIEILPGCGINAENADYVIENTGVQQVHSSCKGFLHDATSSNYGVNFSYGEINKYEVVDSDVVCAILETIKKV